MHPVIFEIVKADLHMFIVKHELHVLLGTTPAVLAKYLAEQLRLLEEVKNV